MFGVKGISPAYECAPSSDSALFLIEIVLIVYVASLGYLKDAG
jgi:hypothetical protein